MNKIKNRKLSRFIAVLVIMALVLTSTCVVLADTRTPSAIASNITIPTVTTPAQLSQLKAVPVSIRLGNSVDEKDLLGGVTKGTRSNYIKLGKGTVLLEVQNTSKDAPNNVSVVASVFRNDGTRVGEEVRATPDYKSTGSVNIPAAGNYVIQLTSSFYPAGDVTYTANVKAAFFPAKAANAKTTLTDNKTVVMAHDGQVDQFIFKATKTGYIKVSTDSYGTVTLFNSKGKPLSKANDIWSSNYQPKYPVYGVKKGKTYIIKMAMKQIVNAPVAFYTVNVKNTKLTAKGASKKSKAKTLKKKKTVKGTVTVGDKRVNWYKFKNTKNKAPTITVKAETNDKIMIKIYKGSKVVSDGTITLSPTEKSGKYQIYGAWDKGTYHIKVYGGNKNSSGWYSIKWN